MLVQNCYLTLLLSVLILVDSQHKQWTDNKNACIYQNNDIEIENVFNMANCKAFCKEQQGCRSVELYHKINKCMLSEAFSRTHELIEPCPILAVTYSEIIDNNAIVQEKNQGVRNAGPADNNALVQENNQGVTNAGLAGCTRNNQCPGKKVCNIGKCVGLCELITCGQGAVCQVVKREARCVCPKSTTGNPRQLCQPIQECNGNLQCANDKICDNGRCVNPCELINCGQGASCQVSGRNPQCICPANTQGDPRVHCRPKQECTGDANCGANKVCLSGRCVNPCDLAKCGQGATCRVFHRRPQCMCPDNTQVNEQVHCRSSQECTGDANCGANKVCRSGRCVNPCDLAKCGQRATCRVFHRRPQCMCPDNTQVNEQVHCRSPQGPSVCQFPFIYRNIVYTACTTHGDPDEKPWCSTKTDGQNNHQKGNWQHCTDNDPRQTPPNIGDRTVIGTPASNNQAILQFTKPSSTPPTNGQGQESTRQAGCYSLPDPGECRGAFPRFYYNQQTDQCDCFLFGGCDEERVKFTWLSFEECLSTCVPTNKVKGPGCQRVTLEEVQRFLKHQ